MSESDVFATARRALAANATRLREQAGWTQQQAAESMGIDVKHLQKLEYGDLNPSLRTLVRVATAFGVTVGRLLAKTSSRRVSRPVGRPRQRRGSPAMPTRG
jgi:transcriptional regulator with XRE-family HTH domain